MESRTVIEWLKQAKAEGYEWAERAQLAVKEQGTYEEGEPSVRENLSDALHCAFTWGDTFEGHKFWSRIYHALAAEGK